MSGSCVLETHWRLTSDGREDGIILELSEHFQDVCI